MAQDGRAAGVADPPRRAWSTLKRREFPPRYLPGIDYGTSGFPPKVARRLRVLNIATWMAATLMAGFAVGEFLAASTGSLERSVLPT